MAHPPRVLLAHDGPEDGILLHEAFVECDVPVHLETVQNGIDAINRIQCWGGRFSHRTPPDLVVLAGQLPKLSGDAVLAFIRSQARHRPIPTLIYSGRMRPGEAQRWLERGADGIIEHPLCFFEYCTAVERILDHLAYRFDDSASPDGV